MLRYIMMKHANVIQQADTKLLLYRETQKHNKALSIDYLAMVIQVNLKERRLNEMVISMYKTPVSAVFNHIYKMFNQLLISYEE